MAGINQIVARDNVTGIAMEMFAGQFDSEIYVVHNVALNYHARSAIDINAVGVGIVPIGWVAAGGDVVHMILGDDSIARPIYAGI